MRHDDPLACFGINIFCGKDALTFGFCLFELTQKNVCIGRVKVKTGIFFLGLTEHIPIFQRNRCIWIIKRHLHHMIHAQNIHRQTLKTIGQLARHRVAIMPAHLLEIGELADLHAITPNFPTKAPSAQSRTFPVVLHKANVMHRHINPNGLKATKIEILQIGRAWFDQHLILVIMLQAVRVLPIPAIGGAARGLHISCRPRPRA